MIGFSFYLQDEDAEKRIKQAAQSGVKRAFTSLHIPEETGNLKERMAELLKLAKSLGIDIHADVSDHTPGHLGIGSLTELLDFGIRGIRLDFGFSPELIRTLANSFSLSLNASTLTERELVELLESGLEPEKLIAWHNYYPRPETGLDEPFFHRQNRMFRRYGITTAAFIPGIGKKRGPLHEGLPTLEKHRYTNPYAAGIELFEEVDDVYVGDPGTEDGLLEKLAAYESSGILSIRVRSTSLEEGLYRLRPDVSRDVHRLEGTRTQGSIEPRHTAARPTGAITMDNDGYGRYRGEIQICRTDLPADARVNVIGQVILEDLPLLHLAKPGQSVQLIVVS